MEKIEISSVLLPMHTYLQSHLRHPIECSCVSIGDTVGHKSTAGFWMRARFICNSQDILTDPRIVARIQTRFTHCELMAVALPFLAQQQHNAVLRLKAAL